MSTNNTTAQSTNTSNAGEHNTVIQSNQRGATVVTIDTALTQFDSLPNAAHVRLPTVKALFGCSSATVWRRVKAREIPEPKKFGGRITAWNVGELRHTLSGAEKTS